MQAVILAAGMGTRLGKYTQDNTKCMLRINGRTLIERALDALDGEGIRKCVIVAGYQKDNLMRFVGAKYKNIDIEYIVNDVYKKTNNIYSLYLAGERLTQDDTILLESDLIFEERVIKDLLDSPEPTLAAVAPYESWMDGTVVQISKNGTVTNVIPRKFFDYNEKETYYKTVNIYKFSKEFSSTCYVPFLNAYSKAMGSNEYYEQVLRVITTLDRNELKALVLSDHKWYEIDDVQDKDIAETIFCETAAEKLSLVGRRYGGYWRFPRMLDFCYLVNPYFPTEQMRNEMKAYFTDLLTEYPSGLNVQNLLMGKLFNLEESAVLAGNGAAELIHALSRALDGTIGVIYPTFNEYPECFGGDRVIPFIPGGFTYGGEELLSFAGRCDTLVLINPDNPSGGWVPSSVITTVLESLQRQNKRLILDESFADFCDDGEVPSLLKQDLLEKFPNLVVVKSLSKSYGIPGIRLGVLASGDRELIAAVRRQLPIWNINAFGEYFLQIIGKYQKDYAASCRQIAGERNRFGPLLGGCGIFEKVYPSQANYFLCRLNDGLSARSLSECLLSRFGIFIKDLTGKKGIPGEGWVRIAVRDRSDNDVFIEKLRILEAERKTDA
ncbi:MAG: aminotransferase class I/II-fold pyridoxal phosphate-dependent enzyme [Spirochaetaceae bacterium]|jgi:histidinol-phosphate/aromatic aminotransferase/cobyric acid decarboxylase-like protein/choline kinase|nr:aminotransferase class I/II-fold pyridoxal phosphate-dependent enzyme [Spirochaetaceae bacterium]